MDISPNCPVCQFKIQEDKAELVKLRNYYYRDLLMGKLDKNFVSSHPELPTKEAVAMRNVLVHDYDWVDTEEVWKTVQKDLPELRIIVEKILREGH